MRRPAHREAQLAMQARAEANAQALKEALAQARAQARAEAIAQARAQALAKEQAQQLEAAQQQALLDNHKVEGLTEDAVAQAHAADLKTQEKHGVDYMKYWFDEETGKVFCLINAPTPEAAAAVHREAHGLEADEIIEVREGA